MAKSNKKPKSNMLNEVKIVATRLSKPSATTAFKSGGLVKSVANSKVDSIKKANPALGKLIGNPVGKAGEAKKYSDVQKDMILGALKPKKKR